MNKPAPKEPSMDEILSSIRQIIADDDAAGVPRRPSIQAAPPPMQATPARQADSLDRDLSDMLDDIEPLALSAAQIVEGDDDDDVGGFSFDSILADTATDEEPVAAAPQLVEPEDVAFDMGEPEDDLPAFDPPPMATMARFHPEPAPEPAPAPRAQAPMAKPAMPQASVAQAAPLPDPTLSSDMADQLLEPATQAAVRSSITKLNGLGLGNTGATIESLMRDMLRPMLKEWLDENLPAVVERMVEKEIARVSRGE
jgi:cell pole-organizing protein PopZ